VYDSDFCSSSNYSFLPTYSCIELLGSKKVLTHLRARRSNHSTTNQPSPLYWRSELFGNDVLEQWPNEEALWFVEITFDFVTLAEKKMVQATFGCYLLQPQKQCLYVQTKPFSQISTLEQHAQNINIDLTSAPPRAMAGMMAKALLVGDLVKLHSKDSTTIQLELFYQDLEESGILSLEIQRQTSTLDDLGILPIYQAIRNPPETAAAAKEAETPTDPRQLIQEFQRWMSQKGEKEKGEASTSNSQIATDSNKRTNPQIHQFQQLKKRSKKKKKITYAKS
jgi:hypothetical protein